MVTMGIKRRGLKLWMARATSSLPVPLSPWMSTVVSLGATVRMLSSTRCMGGLWPTISTA